MIAKNDYLFLLRSAVDSLQIHGIESYSWCGIRHRVLPRKLRSSLAKEDLRSCLISAIEGRLYRDFYCVGGIHRETGKLQTTGSHAATQQFVQMLSDANHGASHFDPDWCVLSISDHSLTIMKDGLRLIADPSDCQSNGPIIQGGLVNLRTSKECFAMTPGFYLVMGSAPGAVRGSASRLVRLYWNVTPQGAVKLLDELTRLLNDKGISFRLKALRDPATYLRCDAVVLYLSKLDLLSVWDALGRLYQCVRIHMKDGVPAMTKQLAPGLGLAEDPKKSTSFGLHRCNLIAQGLVNAWEDKDRGSRLRLNHVAERFAEEGVEISRPYLNPGSQDDYPSIAVRTNRGSTSKTRTIESGVCLEAAVEIGRALAESAIFSNDTCTWAGYRSAHPSREGGATSGIFGTVGPCLYDGCAGIAWFLSELFALTSDDSIGRCAEAALNGAVLAAKSLPSSLFAGWVGVSLSSAYCSGLLSSSNLRNRPIELLNLLDEKTPLATGPDMLSGCAGVISALLLQARLLHDDAFVKVASAFGERLIEAAEILSGFPGLSWPSNSNRKHANLTGLSHGASGVAFALIQLFRVTGRPEFRDCAYQAVLYERALFDPDQQNWPDLRGVPRRSKGSFNKYKFSHYWCHGAPGIGVSRLAGWQYLNSADCLDEAYIAFRSTYAWTSRAIADGQVTGCLCHGVSGNALILWHASESPVNVDSLLYRSLAIATASDIAYKLLDRKPLFGETMQNIDNPSLMLGLAGIGHYLLRLAPVIPRAKLISPLWLE